MTPLLNVMATIMPILATLHVAVAFECQPYTNVKPQTPLHLTGHDEVKKFGDAPLGEPPVALPVHAHLIVVKRKHECSLK